MKPQPKSDAAVVLRAAEEAGTQDAYTLAKRVGWMTTKPMKFRKRGAVGTAEGPAEVGEVVEVRIGGGNRYHTERVQTALAALHERGFLNS